MLKKLTILFGFNMFFIVCCAMNEQNHEIEFIKESMNESSRAYIQLGIKYLKPEYTITQLNLKKILQNRKLIDADGEIIDKDFVSKEYAAAIDSARYYLRQEELKSTLQDTPSCHLQ